MYLFDVDMCSASYRTNPIHIELELGGQALTIFSNNYPGFYPTKFGVMITFFYHCERKLKADQGIFRIKILELNISFEDIVGFGAGTIPTFSSAVYALTSTLKMPIFDNHPKGIYVLPTPTGSYMWILFAAYGGLSQNYHGHSTIKKGRFLLEITMVEKHGKTSAAQSTNTVCELYKAQHILPLGIQFHFHPLPC